MFFAYRIENTHGKMPSLPFVIFFSQNVSFLRATNMFRNGFNAYPMQRPTMGDIMFVGLWHLRTLFGTYEHFISVLWKFLLYWQCS